MSPADLTILCTDQEPYPSLRRVSSSVFDTPVTSHPIEGSAFQPAETSSRTNTPDHSSTGSTDRKHLSPDLTDVSICCISGGTGGNAICSAFGRRTTFILPISDDGGSSSEILRCLGGPSIGDIRSRLIRLAPAYASSSSLGAIIRLLSYRLPAEASEQEVKSLWREIVEGTSELWDGVAEDRKEILHRFFVHFESEILQRAHKGFSFRNCSLGNVFLSSAQRFFLSLPAAIFLFASITEIQSQCSVIPAILTNHTATIAAELENGETIVGQCNISHPAVTEPALSDSTVESATNRSYSSPLPVQVRLGKVGLEDGIYSLGRGGVSQSSKKAINTPGGSNLVFKRTGEAEDENSLDATQGLTSRIKRILYINVYGQEIFPTPNPEFLSSLATRELFVYSCGSLWTSIMPCLALEGVGSAIATSTSLKAKIFLLNSSNDRETIGYTALTYIEAIVRTLNRHDSPVRQTHSRRPSLLSSTFLSSSVGGGGNASTPTTLDARKNNLLSFRIKPSQLISHLIYLESGKVDIETDVIEALGIKVIRLQGTNRFSNSRFSTESTKEALRHVMLDTSTS
ncbi:LPPG:FO 2-phospho-L-lactate transferase CofD/UPF0052 [Phaffia rhodozyma]|uniref:LPPG:FO 2-phospho-L-lactate transferase CofD/UPF0052 n=1 Tax=Phaffia rhodozyma TaxID=264483 RepID=A0A0F7SMV6_PHARH|nr:LPPG:FO 2-phospho-L-lactate transferase CofD/UPF0052 [Phaffia rhodozyma]